MHAVCIIIRINSLFKSFLSFFFFWCTFAAAGSALPYTPGSPSWQRIDPFFGIWFSMGFDTVVVGVIVLGLMTCRPGAITERERRYPKRMLLFAGALQAVSAVTFQFSTGGTRTAPYLQASLSYFYIPIAFTLR